MKVRKLPLISALTITAAALGCALVAGPSRAQSTATAAPPAPAPIVRPAPPADDALYRQLGAADGIARIVDDFIARMTADKGLGPMFVDTDMKRLKRQLELQLCEVSGGPCQLAAKDADMRKRHAGFDIDKAAFNQVVEMLQSSLDAQGVPFTTQNRLLAQLAPMHRDIVNVR